jgi:hypothetical protein
METTIKASNNDPPELSANSVTRDMLLACQSFERLFAVPYYGSALV